MSKSSHRQLRAEMWAKRLPQMLASTDRRPYWQFRAVGDSLDPPACKVLSGRVERHDSAFWNANAPWHCSRPECRCTVRAYTHAELVSKSLPIPN